MYLNAATTGIVKTIAESSNPWLYLVVFICIGGAFIIRQVFQYLIKLDETHRSESIVREAKTNEQLDKAINANVVLGETQKEIVRSITDMNGTLSTVRNDVGELKVRMNRYETNH